MATTGKSHLNVLRQKFGLMTAKFVTNTSDPVRENGNDFQTFQAVVVGGAGSKSKISWTKTEAEQDAAVCEFRHIFSLLAERVEDHNSVSFIRDCQHHAECSVDDYKIYVSDQEHENDIVMALTAMIDHQDDEHGSPCIVGLDCEWTQSSGKQLTLIQVADHDTCVLIRCGASHNNSKSVIEAVKALLNSDAVMKCGVDLDQDIVKLNAMFSITMDIGTIKDIGCDIEENAHFGCMKKPGLSNLVSNLLEKKTSYKNCNTSLTFNDITAYLTDDQKHYAAMDAILSYRLGRRIADAPKGELSNIFKYCKY